MRRLFFRILLLAAFFLFILTIVAAQPPFPDVFYGEVYDYGVPAPVGVTIRATYAGGSCDPFTTSTIGHFGSLVCPGDDPSTPEVEGAVEGANITFTYENEPVAIVGITSSNLSNVSGSVYTSSVAFKNGSFTFLVLSHPVPYCGDLVCDQFFETFYNCPLDCPNTTGNQSGNETNTTNNETGQNETNGGEGDYNPPSPGGSGGGGGGSGGSGGGGGGGGGSGGGGGNPFSDFQQLFGGLPTSLEEVMSAFTACEERWSCTSWPECPPLGVRNRTCTDENECGTEKNKPPEVEACEYLPSCFDGLQNGDETGVDCGGSCKPCASCSNGIQDCVLLDNGTRFCEEGIDCGGPCRPCDSCENGIRDWTETGIDCGGLYCLPCSQLPVIQIPFPICERDINPFRNDLIFFLLFMFLLIITRVGYGIRQLRRVTRMKELDDLAKAKARYRIKRSIYTFVGIILLLTIIIYFYYYYFVLCEVSPQYLWWLLFLLVALPLLVHVVIRHFEYNEKEKLRKMERLTDKHRQHLIRLVEIENSSIASLEKELSEEIYEAMRDSRLRDLFNEYPDLAAAYRNMLTLYERYREKKNPFELERELCEEVYRLETDEQFTALAKLYPAVSLIYRKLRMLYQHYETKQQLYDEIDKDDSRIDQDINTMGKKGDGKQEEAEQQSKERAVSAEQEKSVSADSSAESTGGEASPVASPANSPAASSTNSPANSPAASSTNSPANSPAASSTNSPANSPAASSETPEKSEKQ